MAGISTGPGFMSRLGGQLPGMVNAAAQQFGNPSMRNAVAGSASLLSKQKQPRFNPARMAPKVTTGIDTMPGTQVPLPSNPINIQAPGLTPPQEISAEMPINTGPSAPIFQNPYANIFSASPGYGRSGNTGIAGGLFNRPPGYERPNMGAGGIDIGGLFGRFNQFSQNPNVRY